MGGRGREGREWREKGGRGKGEVTGREGEGEEEREGQHPAYKYPGSATVLAGSDS